MNLTIVEDAEAMGRFAADIFEAQIKAKPESVLGLATGSTPVPLYQQLVRDSREGKVDFSGVRTVNLDEYAGLSPENPQSYRYFMQENLFDHISILPEHTALPNGRAKDLAAECLQYDQRISDWGGIDLQLLGIGHNGHIGFNEPGTVFEKKTHVVTIAKKTRMANARFFDGDIHAVPKMAITMGIGNIMKARKIILLVSGESKAKILDTALFGDISPAVPASVLQLHPDVTVIADVAAAGLIENKIRSVV